MRKCGSIFLLLGLLLNLSSLFAQSPLAPLWRGEGRIVMSSDGNEHDWDDWAASPMSLAILASQGLQDKLTLYTYSDHVWGSNQRRGIVNGMCAYNHMRESVLRGCEYFGFKNTDLFCAVDNAEIAYDKMRDEINRSSAESPMFIIAAGPMQVIGEGMNRANKECLKYVTIISHSIWNNVHSDKTELQFDWDRHTGWTYAEMREAFGEKTYGAKFIQIVDQNRAKGGTYIALQAPRENFDWLVKSKAKGKKRYAKGSWEWLYTRLESCAVENNTVFDVSDSGMVVYLLTGNQEVTPQMIQQMMENPK